MIPFASIEALEPYRKFCECGPDYDRSIRVAVDDVADAITKNYAMGIRYFSAVLRLRTKEITFEQYQEAVKP